MPGLFEQIKFEMESVISGEMVHMVPMILRVMCDYNGWQK